MAKKAGKLDAHIVITPPILVDVPNYPGFYGLCTGQVFIYENSLYMKTDNEDQVAVNLATGEETRACCDYMHMVVPVTVKITWTLAK